jgi:SDR family mycofactocin-dependent oxidoreductase
VADGPVGNGVGLEGRVALITGAARGQGRAHAAILAQHGMDIIATDVVADVATAPYPMAGEADLEATAKEVVATGRRVVTARADVRSQSDLDAAVALGLAEFGRIDVLVANAGIWAIRPFWELSESEWTELVDINLSGVWRAAKAVAPHMIERRSGSIVMTSSINGLEPARAFAHYVAAKHGVIGLMRSVALELAPYGVRCNAVCPAAVDTAMTNWQGCYDMFAGGPGGTRDDLVSGGPQFHALAGMGMLDPRVVAQAVLWLAGDGASAVTGTALPVDAGHLLLPGSNPDAAP